MQSEESELQNAVSGGDSDLGSQPTAVRRQKPPDFARIRRDFPNSYKPWSEHDEIELSRLIDDSASIAEIAKKLQRKPSAVRSKIRQRLS